MDLDHRRDAMWICYYNLRDVDIFLEYVLNVGVAVCENTFAAPFATNAAFLHPTEEGLR